MTQDLGLGPILIALRYIAVARLLYTALVFSPTEAPPFIYFAF